MMLFRSAMIVLLLAGMCAAEESKTAFDPARHMRVSEVREGMTGYGLSVFKGTKIDRFDVEVLSILKNFNPKYDVILVRCKGANLEHTGSIAGMSGSPIFLKDDQGRERMVGAFAYGWPLMKDPVGGVQPIEYMLGLETEKPAWLADPATKPSGSESASMNPRAAQGRVSWSLRDVALLPGMKEPPAKYPFAALGSMKPNPRLGGMEEELTRLRPLATPLMTAGVPPKLLSEFSAIFRAYGLELLQAGGSSSASANHAPAKLEPGSVLAVPLLTGDLDMTAIGTCTEVIGDKMWGFGHAFNNEGAVTLPMGSGEINAIIANLATSFKLGTLTKIRGTLLSDEIVGVAGRSGDPPALIPVDLKVVYADGSENRNYHFEAAAHPRFTPLITSLAVAAAVSGAKELPQYHTLDYDLNLEFANKQIIKVTNTAVNTNAAEVFFAIGTPMIAAADNPFERVAVKKVTGTLRVTPEAREARILSVNVPRSKFRPGETIKAYVTYRPFRAAEAILPVELELPRDMEDGDYDLQISDWQKFMEDEQQSKPFRFTADSSEEMFDVLRDVATFKRNALYLRLLRKPDGVAIGRTAMPQLPSSRRQVLLDANRSNVTPFVSATTKSIPTAVVMEGTADFTITVDAEARVETASGHGGKIEKIAPGAPPKMEEKPKGNKSEKPDAPTAGVQQPG